MDMLLKEISATVFTFLAKGKAYRESVTISYRIQIGDTSDMGIRV
jgi:hypothetical protein